MAAGNEASDDGAPYPALPIIFDTQKLVTVPTLESLY